MERIYNGCERIVKNEYHNNLKEMLNYTKEHFGDRPAFKFKDKDNNIQTKSYNEYYDDITALGTALISIGLKGKRIGVISENRFEWEEAYLAIACGTGIVVPLDKALPENELLSLIERSEIEAIFYSSKYDAVMKKAKEENIGKIDFYISMDLDKKESDKIYSQKELVNIGKDLVNNGAKTFINAEINNDEMSIMLFTSGTTSQSKCVMLSQTNICSNIYDIASTFDCNTNDCFLSFLPLHHVFECTVGFLYPVSIGACIAFCTGIRHIAENLKDFEVSAMISVPALFDGMYRQVMKGIDKKGKTKAVKFGMKLSNLAKKCNVDITRKLFKEIYDSLGGKIRLFVAGAAAFDPEVEKGFNALGIECCQGYGLTETAPVIAAEHKTCMKIGSIGRAMPSVQVKIKDPDEFGIGELCAKGPNIMLGYYGNVDSPFDEDGWFMTGDLAYIDKDGYIFITGRKKSVIVLKNGKNVFPEEIEALINKIPGVKESFVYGKPEENDAIDLKVCAEIVYDKDNLNSIFGTENLDEVKEKIWESVKKVNTTMPQYKYVREICITDEELIKTTTLKIKRFEEIKKVLK